MSQLNKMKKIILLLLCMAVSLVGQEDKHLFPVNDACGFHGYMDIDGNIVIRPQPEWTRVWDFNEGFAKVETRIEVGRNKKLGNAPIYKKKTIIINTKGEIVIDLGESNTTGFYEGFAGIEDENKLKGFINTKGEIVIKPQFKNTDVFFEDRAIVKIEKDGHDMNAVIDKTGKIIWGPKPGLIEPYSDGLACFGIEKDDWSYPRNWLFGYIDLNGKEVIPPQYRDAGNFHDGIAAVTPYSGGDYYIDKRGKEILRDVKKTLAGSFTEGFGKIKRNGKWGFINIMGVDVIECKFEDVMNFSDGIAAFTNDKGVTKRWGFIDKSGQVICEPQFAEPMFFKNGLAKVVFPMNPKTGEENEGYVNKQGKIIFIDDKEHCIEGKKEAPTQK